MKTLVLKTILSILLITTFFSFVQAATYYPPPVCKTSEAHFNIRSFSHSPQVLGLQTWTALAHESETLNLDPLEKKSLSFTEAYRLNIVDFLNTISSLEISIHCPLQEKSFAFTKQTSPVSFFTISNAGHFNIKNISALKNLVKVYYKKQSSWVELQASELAPFDDYYELEINFESYPVEIKIESEFRSLSSFVYGSTAILPHHYKNKKILREKDKSKYTYFLVGMQNTQGQLMKNQESYVVRLSSAEQIAEARSIIKEKKSRIIIGEIALGHGGFNRDMNDDFKSPYSWHFKKISSFSELASDACNGDPAKLEMNLPEWLENNPYACFWPYRLIKEIPESSIDGE